ncbi:hypothetical protein BGW39_007792 [Mortierella sp. 14UC]|nr:hypothetical protein BGW39_007792 [Mortierella sp. 14UC]
MPPRKKHQKADPQEHFHKTQWIIAIISLAKMHMCRRTQTYKFVQCDDCGDRFITQRKNPHKSTDNKVMTNEEYQTLVHFTYPHELYELATREEKMTLSNGSITRSAPWTRSPRRPPNKDRALARSLKTGSGSMGPPAICRRDLLKDRIIFETGTFGQDEEEARNEVAWRATMAIDVLLEVSAHCSNDRVPEDDEWVIRSISKTTTVLEYFKSFADSDSENEEDGRNTIRHNCNKKPDLSSVIKDSWFFSFDDLPFAVARRLWYIRWEEGGSDEKSCEFLNWSFSEEQKQALRDWLQEQGNEEAFKYVDVTRVHADAELRSIVRRYADETGVAAASS